jgi:hypothetical protein
MVAKDVSILPGFFVLEERDFFTTFQDDRQFFHKLSG